MTRNWIDTESDDDADARVADFWTGLRSDLDAGEFWADRIKTYKGDPAKRLKLALKNLPLPAAFREAAIAVRALIRAKRREGESFEEELRLLYWLAAVRSFPLDYAPRLREPGFNVLEAIPGQRLHSLRYEYAELGFDQLTLLNKTDRKWLVELWGQPESHTTLNELHRDLWEEYEDKLIEKRGRADRELRARFAEPQIESGESAERTRPEDRNGCAIAAIAAVPWLMGLGG